MEDYTDEDLRRFVDIFIHEFKQLVLEGKIFVKEHYKNNQALFDLGISKRRREEIILSLTYKNYSSGPIADELKPGHYWVFGRDYGGVDVYIKLKIVTYNDGNERAVCISFHPCEYPMKFPFRR